MVAHKYSNCLILEHITQIFLNTYRADVFYYKVWYGLSSFFL